VYGLKIDYLSPTVFFSDIFIALFIFVSFIDVLLSRKQLIFSKKIFFLLFSFLCSIIISSLVNGGGSLFYFKFLKILEFSLYAYFVAFLNFKKIFYPFVLVISFNTLWTSILAIFQFFSQHSLGLWFIGERNFNLSTAGISKFVYSDRLFLRPYATFPHPNLLGGYLSLFLPWILFFLFKEKTKLKTLFFLSLSFAFGILALFLTFSRTAWLFGLGAVVAVFICFGLMRVKNFFSSWVLRMFFAVFLILILIGIFTLTKSLILERFFTIYTTDSHSMILREKFAEAAILMFLNNPLFGVGPGNFIPNLPHFWKLQETIRILQPAHNLFLLILAEVGILGALFFTSLFLVTVFDIVGILKKNKAMPSLLIISFLGIVFLSMFDHYFWTLQQGLFIFWLILGLAWSFCYREKEIKK